MEAAQVKHMQMKRSMCFFRLIEISRLIFLSSFSLPRPKGDPPISASKPAQRFFHVIPATGHYQSGGEKGVWMLVKHYQRHMNLPRTKVELRLPSHSRIHP